VEVEEATQGSTMGEVVMGVDTTEVVEEAEAGEEVCRALVGWVMLIVR
jgi:hypothetical protein